MFIGYFILQYNPCLVHFISLKRRIYLSIQSVTYLEYENLAWCHQILGLSREKKKRKKNHCLHDRLLNWIRHHLWFTKPGQRLLSNLKQVRRSLQYHQTLGEVVVISSPPTLCNGKKRLKPKISEQIPLWPTNTVSNVIRIN